MSIQKLILMFAALTVFTCTVAAQDQTQAQPKKVIEHAAIKPTSPASGKEMYTSYCAVCHGTDGKGGGPAASALKTAPSDLTTLTKNNGGKFPLTHTAKVIAGEPEVAGQYHQGSAEAGGQALPAGQHRGPSQAWVCPAGGRDVARAAARGAVGHAIVRHIELPRYTAIPSLT